MNKIIVSEARYRQRVVKYSFNHGVSRAAIRFRVCRQSIYNWRIRYDGESWKSLVEGSHRPEHHPNEHTPKELEDIQKRYPYYKDDMLLLYQQLTECGYKRKYKSMLRVIKRMYHPEEKKRKGRKPKGYKRASYPGQKVQIDVKYVPSECVVNGQKYYQYTAVDECTRFTYREMYDEHSTYSSADFLRKLIAAFPVPIREIQTDNGTEWTNALLKKNSTHITLFEKELIKNGIIYHRIRVATPRHNGKVERQHRLDGERFYSKMRMYSLEDGRQQLARYNKKSNNYIKICLDYKSPNQVMNAYLGVM